jgi:hypothetical protein
LVDRGAKTVLQFYGVCTDNNNIFTLMRKTTIPLGYSITCYTFSGQLVFNQNITTQTNPTCAGIAFDGYNFYVLVTSDPQNIFVYHVTPTATYLIRTISTSATLVNCKDLCFNGHNLITVDNTNIYFLSVENGAIVSTVPHNLAGVTLTGITCDDKYLYIYKTSL